jgi:hypothetical protein
MLLPLHCTDGLVRKVGIPALFFFCRSRTPDIIIKVYVAFVSPSRQCVGFT